MLEKFQSAEAITSQIESGWEYYIAKLEGADAGYTGLVPDADRQKMMLSKLYVQKTFRGLGVGQRIIEFIEAKCRAYSITSLWLTVNRFNNGPIEWYKHHGFRITDEVKKDIGGGFVMDDYIMEKTI